MNASAVVLMVVAMLILWGGLALAIANLLLNAPSERPARPTDERPGWGNR